MSRAETCGRCGARVKLLRLNGVDDVLEFDLSPYIVPAPFGRARRRPTPKSLFVVVRQGVVERVESETSRRRPDGSRGPFLVRHAERCPR